MDRVLRAATYLLLTCVLAAAVLCAPTVYRGFEMYESAVEAAPIHEKVIEIRSSRDYVPLDQISEEFKSGIIRSEDKRFQFHFGIDPLAVLRAVKNDIAAGAFVEGGSTITQQLAKNMYFDFDKVFERKVAEVFVALQLERDYTKDEILELYLNCIYFGEDCYGIKAASAHYYDTSPAALSSEESAALVYTIKCPNLYNPNEI